MLKRGLASTLFAATALSSIAIGLPALADQPPLRVAMTLADIPTTDGAPDQGTEGIRFMGFTVYDALLRWDLSSADKPAQLVPGLATSWKQDPADPSRWIFELRQGVKFHDGSMFNADAVIWNLDRALNDKSPQFDRGARAQTIASLWAVKGYRKIDDWHVELQTDGIDTLMPFMLNRFVIASPAQWEKVGRDVQALRKAPSGTGPWKLKSFTPRQQAELVRNEDYWDKDRIPKSERMILFPMPDSSARAAALLSGAVDWAELPAPDTVPKLKAAGFNVATNVIPHIWPYSLNVLPDSPLADIRVRKALNYAIDRDGLVKLLNGLAIPSVANVPPGDPWFGNPSFKIKYDPAEAKRLLKEAGYNDTDKRLKIKIMISTSGSGQMYPLIMNEFIQQTMADIGVDMEVQVFEWQAMLNLNRKGAKSPDNREFAGINNSYNTMDPYQAFIRFADSQLVPPKGSNWGYIDDRELDSLVAKAHQSTGAELDTILAQIDTRMVDQAYFVWIVHDVWPTALSPKVRGFVHAKSWYVDFSPVSVVP